MLKREEKRSEYEERTKEKLEELKGEQAGRDTKWKVLSSMTEDEV